MYFDVKPCSVCGSSVSLRAADATPEPDGPVGPSDGFVGTADASVDDRVCSNAACPTNTDAPDRPTP